MLAFAQRIQDQATDHGGSIFKMRAERQQADELEPAGSLLRRPLTTVPRLSWDGRTSDSCSEAQRSRGGRSGVCRTH